MAAGSGTLPSTVDLCVLSVGVTNVLMVSTPLRSVCSYTARDMSTGLPVDFTKLAVLDVEAGSWSQCASGYIYHTQ